MKNHLAYYNTYFALLKEYLPVYPVCRGTFIGPFCRVSKESLMRALIIFCRSFWRTLSISKSLMSLTLLELLDFIRWCGGGNQKLSVQLVIAKSKRRNFIYGFDTVQVNGSNGNEYKMTFVSEESWGKLFVHSSSVTFIRFGPRWKTFRYSCVLASSWILFYFGRIHQPWPWRYVFWSGIKIKINPINSRFVHCLEIT